MLALAVAVIVAACGSATGSPSAAASTTVSGSLSACVTAPAPTSAPGWQTASGDPSVFPVMVSSEQVCGQNRFLFTFVDKDNKPAALPGRTASVAFFNLGRDPERVAVTAEASFHWMVEGRTGIYVATVAYPEAGEWGVEFRTATDGGARETIRARFEVRASGVVPAIGTPAPATKNLTLADVGGDVARISTDTAPDPRFYETSVDQALAAHKPFVLIFATPAFCQTQACGPMLDQIKSVAKAHPNVTFINVEPYQLEYADGRLQPVLDATGQLQPVQAVRDYRLPAEPWAFLVDATGTIRGSFEATVGADELTAAIAAAIEAVAGRVELRTGSAQPPGRVERATQASAARRVVP